MAEIVPIRQNIVIPKSLTGVLGTMIPEQVEEIVSEPRYGMDTISRIENELGNINLSLPASKSPDIPQIFEVIKQIVGGNSIQEIFIHLEDTRTNSARSRSDLQRCGAILQKIAGIQDKTLNWNLIFSRLKLEYKKEAT